MQLEHSLSGAPVLNQYGVLVLNRQSHHFFLADVRISLNLAGERSLLEKISNPDKREVSRDSVQCPLEGYKCLGSLFELLVLAILSVFLFFIPLKGALKRVPVR